MNTATVAAPTALLGLAHAHRHAGRSVEAEMAYRQVLAVLPQHPVAWQGLGVLYSTLGRHDEALLALTRALGAAPGSAALHVDIGQVLRAAGRYAEASGHFDSAVALDPGNRSYGLLALLHRGTWLDEQGKPEKALACFEQAAREHPDSADAWATLGTVQAHLAAPELAAASLQRALQLDPSRPEVIERFGRVLQDQGRFEDAALVFERLLQIDPQRPLVLGRLLHTKMLCADWTALDALQQRVEQAIRAGHVASEPFGLQGCVESPALLALAARGYNAVNAPDASATMAPAVIGREGPIRIGYLCGEFRNQATSVLLTQVLECHDRTRFQIVGFDNGWDDGSALRKRIEAAIEIEPIRRVPDRSVAERIRSRGIHILVNLNGYFGQARNGVFALRPAPLQVNYLGFPGTLGAPYIDYIIADRSVIPEGDSSHYSERVVYLPHSYQANDATRRVAALPARRADVGLPEHGFVFCCLNNVYKIVPTVFSAWMRVLQRVPGSVLMLYSAQSEAQANLRQQARAQGVDPARLVFGGPLGNEQHLARLRLANLFLDTLPYNAHTTASDALWAGLPVLTCVGSTFPGRVGASLLRAVGLPELVTETLADYEALAVRLATVPGLLKGLRGKLALQLANAPLYDTPLYTRHLEDAFEQMVQRARAGLRPAPITVLARD